MIRSTANSRFTGAGAHILIVGRLSHSNLSKLCFNIWKISKGGSRHSVLSYFRLWCHECRCRFKREAAVVYNLGAERTFNRAEHIGVVNMVGVRLSYPLWHVLESSPGYGKFSYVALAMSCFRLATDVVCNLFIRTHIEFLRVVLLINSPPICIWSGSKESSLVLRTRIGLNLSELRVYSRLYSGYFGGKFILSIPLLPITPRNRSTSGYKDIYWRRKI